MKKRLAVKIQMDTAYSAASRIVYEPLKEREAHEAFWTATARSGATDAVDIAHIGGLYLEGERSRSVTKAAPLEARQKERRLLSEALQISNRPDQLCLCRGCTDKFEFLHIPERHARRSTNQQYVEKCRRDNSSHRWTRINTDRAHRLPCRNVHLRLAMSLPFSGTC